MTEDIESVLVLLKLSGKKALIYRAGVPLEEIYNIQKESKRILFQNSDTPWCIRIIDCNAKFACTTREVIEYAHNNNLTVILEE